MTVNICVWDAQFSGDYWNPGLLWPPKSLAYSLASLHCLFFFTFRHLSFVISQHVHGNSLHRLSVSIEIMTGMCARTHKHMSAKQRPYLPSREFFSFSATWREYKGAELCMPCEDSFSCCSQRL